MLTFQLDHDDPSGLAQQTAPADWRVQRGKSAHVKPFVSPKTALGDLEAEAAAALIAAAADITIVLDTDGVISDVAVRTDDLAADLQDPSAWRGKPFAATVAPDSNAKVQALLAEAASNAETRWRHINHLVAGGRSVPILYCCVQLGEGGRLVAFGRDLRDLSALQQRLVVAQQSMERDYTRMRDVETRYRLLFQLSSEAVMILEAARMRVLEANPAARAIFDAPADDMSGAALATMFTPESVALVEAHFGAVRAGVRVDDIVARTRGGRDIMVKASFFRQESDALFLVRVAPLHGQATTTEAPDAKAKLLWAVERAPDGFVVTDGDSRVIIANAAFFDMVQITHEENARGRPLDDWIGSSGVDVAVLIANLRQRGAVRFFASTIRGEEGSVVQVEISAVSIRNGGQPCFGFAIRNVAPRMASPGNADSPGAARALPRSVEQLTELIGQVPLKDLVREATEVIERLCIEAALELTGNNRASAAEMLGLSRQSLYVKLRRYGLGDLGAGADEAAEAE